MNLDVTFSSNENNYDVDMQIDNAVTVVHDDHALLSNRDAADAHPMSAITGLEEVHADIRKAIEKKISQGDLQGGIDTALAQAKSSGEFDGKDGAQGEKGADGKTPVKGVDYWTETDKAEIVEDTKQAVDLSGYAEKSELEGYLPLTGGTLSGGVIAPNFQTGTANDAYFQTKKMRGQGDANTYNHAVDWGYAGHDKVDFYEYGGTWNFYQCQGSSIKAARLIGTIGLKGWNGGAVLTGTPTAPTAEAGTSTTQIATTEFVMNAIAAALSELKQ